mgnify:CR=1 FL=1
MENLKIKNKNQNLTKFLENLKIENKTQNLQNFLKISKLKTRIKIYKISWQSQN